MAEDGKLTSDKIKKEPEDSVSDDFESIDHSFGDDGSIKDEPVDKDVADATKSDDDMQG